MYKTGVLLFIHYYELTYILCPQQFQGLDSKRVS